MSIQETLEACQIVINALAVGTGGLSYHPASMVELSNHISVAIEESKRLKSFPIDGVLVSVNKSGKITCKVCGRGMSKQD